MKIFIKQISIVFVLALSCSTAPEFDRTNINDAGAENFIPDPPKNPPVKISLLDDKQIQLSWDKRKNQDGVIISKSYSGTSNYSLLDTLFSDTLFIDDSGKFIEGTTYKFDFFRDVEDIGFVFNDSTLLKTVTLQKIERMGFGYQNYLLFDFWIDQSNSDELPYFDGVFIEINDTRVGRDNWVEVLEIPDEKLVIDGINTTSLKFNLFELELRMTQFIFDSLSNRIPVATLTSSKTIHKINYLNYTVIDEMNGELRWSNPIHSYTEGYIISGSYEDTLNNLNQNEYPINFTQPPSYPVTFTVTPFIGSNFGNTLTSHGRWANISPPVFSGLRSIDEQSVELEWRSSGEHAAGYFLESKVSNEDLFTVVDSTNAVNRKILVNGLDPTMNYDFKVRSYTSDDSPTITTEFINSLTIETQDELNQAGSIPKFSKNKKYIAKLLNTGTSWGNNAIYIRNTLTGEEYVHDLPIYPDSHRPQILDFTISESTNSIAYTSDNHSIDNTGKRITVYDFINDQILLTNEVGFGVYKIQTLENDSSFAYTNYGHNNNYIIETNPFSNSNTLPTGSIPVQPGLLEMINHSNTVLNCNESTGLILINLDSQAESIIQNEPCIQINYQPADETAIIRTMNEFKVIDINSGSLLNSYQTSNDFNPDAWLTNYLRAFDIFIYNQNFQGYRIIMNGVTLDFLIPSLTENRSSLVYYVEQIAGNRYQLLTYDSDITVDLTESWSITNTTEN